MIAAEPAALPARPPRAYTRIDWKTAVDLLADGHSAVQAATAIGISEDRLWRHWQRSQRFRNHVQALVERRRGLLGLQLGPAAAAAALARCRAPDGLSARETEPDAAMLTLLAGGDLRTDAPAASSTRERVEAIGRAGARPRRPAGQPQPPMATAAEPAASPAADAPPRVVTVRRLTMHRVTTPSQLPPAPISAPISAPAPGGTERAETVPNGPERVETGRNEPQRSAPALRESAPPPFPARPDFITDLPSPDFPDGIPYARSSPGGGGPG